MSSDSPELNFSLPELEESGLLDCDVTFDSANDTLRDDQIWAAAQSQLNDKNYATFNSPKGPQQLKQLQADLSNSSAQQARSQQLHAVQEKRYNSREYQKRFRERQKAKAQAAANLLADTTSELEQLKLQRQELEARLEQAEAKIDAASKADAQKSNDPFAEGPLIISLPGQEQEISFEEAQSMPSQQFVTLWQVYQRELQRLLEELQEGQECSADSRLCTLTLEALRFRGFSLSFTFSGNSTKAGAKPPAAPPDLHKQVEHIVELLKLSKEQIQDLMFLRRVYFLRRHELEAKRAPDQKKAQKLDAEAMYGVIRMIGAAMRLQENTVEDIRTRIRFGWAMYLGVFTIKQTAQMLINVDARFEYKEAMWNHLAEQHGYPTLQQLLAFAPFGLTHCDWNFAWDYTESVSPCQPIRTGYVAIPRSAEGVLSL